LDRHLVRQLSHVVGKALHTFDQERRVRKARSFRAPSGAGEGIGARVDGDREGTWLGPRPVQDVAAIARAHVHEDVAETGGYCGDLTDVDVDEMLAEKFTHTSMLAPAGTAGRLASGKPWRSGAADDRDQSSKEEARTEEHQDRREEPRAERVGSRKAAAPGKDERRDA